MDYLPTKQLQLLGLGHLRIRRGRKRVHWHDNHRVCQNWKHTTAVTSRVRRLWERLCRFWVMCPHITIQYNVSAQHNKIRFAIQHSTIFYTMSNTMPAIISNTIIPDVTRAPRLIWKEHGSSTVLSPRTIGRVQLGTIDAFANMLEQARLFIM